MSKSFAVYGTAFEDLEDEEKVAITRKPKGIQDEIVTDERGRRRFHGAFTGGFSAGYFNTVGSKHGWVPQTFKSSRDSRAEKAQISAEDFMDEEDMGEFGIASRKIRTKRDFMDAFAFPGEKPILAWERAPQPSTSSDGGLSSRLEELIRPVQDSIGTALLRKMGWRQGRGIGPKMSRKALERQKVNELRAQGKKAEFDQESVELSREFVPGFEFSPDDIARVYFKSKEDKHGLGYVGMQETSVLKQSYGEMVSSMKVHPKSKGIRGQAFGVGAFEDDDEDIYTNYDLSQYDFELDTGSSSVPQISRYDSTFVQSTKKSALRKSFPMPKLPQHFKAGHKPIPIDTKKMPEEVRKLGQKMTALQRAQFLGERDISVMEMLSDKDRAKLRRGSSRWDKRTEDVEKEVSSRTADTDPFEEEPMKSHRFKKYIYYLRRGLTYPQPVEMTQLEWERELEEFQRHLSPDLRTLLPEVRARQQPLANVAYADSIMEQMQSRFQKETKHSTDEGHEKIQPPKDHDRISAVKMKIFGEKTRIRYDWHPAKELCKRFNIPDPYPGSALVGVLQLQKKATDTKSESIIRLANVGLPNTANELARKREREEFEQETRRMAGELESIKTEGEAEETAIEKPMVELLKAIFEESDSEDEPEEENEETTKEINEPVIERPNDDYLKKFEPKPLAPSTTKVLTVMELVESDEEEEFGPKPPPNSLNVDESTGSPEITFIPRPNRIERTSSKDRAERKPSKEEKHSKKLKHKKHKKEKKKKHKKEKHRSKKKDRPSSDDDSVISLDSG